MKKSNPAIATFIDQKYLPLEQKYKVAIAVCILLIPVIACYFVFFQPNADKITNLTKKQQGLEKQLQEVHKTLRDKPKLQRELAETTAAFEEASQVLPKEKEIPRAPLRYFFPRAKRRLGF